jgi:DNA modification methylase
MMASMADIRDRIVELRRVKASELLANPKNWRRHPKSQQDAIGEMLGKIGYADALLARDTPDGLMLIDGHLRAETTPDAVVPVLILDVNDEEADLILTTLDPLASMAETDSNNLESLLAQTEIESKELRELLESLLDKHEIEPEVHPEDDDVPDSAPPISQPGYVWEIGPHRLIVGDSTDPDTYERLMAGEVADIVWTDPPYGVAYVGKTEEALTIENDAMSLDELESFLGAALTAACKWTKAGGAWYVASPAGPNFLPFAKVLTALEIWRQTLVWMKDVFVMGRSDFHYKHECQPPGTQILMSGSGYNNATEIPIEKIKNGDKVVTWSQYGGQIQGRSLNRGAGHPVQVAKRDYSGELYTVWVEELSTRATDNHKWTTRLTHSSFETWVTYLMRRGEWWRIGQARLFNTWGCAIKSRLAVEKADEAWILDTYDSLLEARCAEQMLSCKYGIPTTMWTVKPTNTRSRSEEYIRKLIYDKLDLVVMDQRAEEALRDYGRRREYPFVTPESRRTKFSRRATMQVESCNLLPGFMEVPLPDNPGDAFRWGLIGGVTREPYSGPVYSLEVDRTQHYIADGIVTHNSIFYGWKPGAAHHEPPDRKQDTVWEIPRPKASRQHPTAKPVELVVRSLMMSSDKGDVVLDPFGGSGTTMIAAHRTGRVARLVELDPRYADVILRRIQEVTGIHPVLAASGQQFDFTDEYFDAQAEAMSAVFDNTNDIKINESEISEEEEIHVGA